VQVWRAKATRWAHLDALEGLGGRRPVILDVLRLVDHQARQPLLPQRLHVDAHALQSKEESRQASESFEVAPSLLSLYRPQLNDKWSLFVFHNRAPERQRLRFCHGTSNVRRFIARTHTADSFLKWRWLWPLLRCGFPFDTVTEKHRSYTLPFFATCPSTSSDSSSEHFFLDALPTSAVRPSLAGTPSASQRISFRAHLIARQDDVSGGLLARLLGAVGPRSARRLQGAGVRVDLLEPPIAAVEGGHAERGGEARDLLLPIAASRKTPLALE
jgi:hypothetical protein